MCKNCCDHHNKTANLIIIIIEDNNIQLNKTATIIDNLYPARLNNTVFVQG